MAINIENFKFPHQPRQHRPVGADSLTQEFRDTSGDLESSGSFVLT